MSKLIDTITDLETRMAKLEATQPPSGNVAAEITALQTQQAAMQTQIANIDNLTPDAPPPAP